MISSRVRRFSNRIGCIVLVVRAHHEELSAVRLTLDRQAGSTVGIFNLPSPGRCGQVAPRGILVSLLRSGSN
jgi:hypothetical protein